MKETDNRKIIWIASYPKSGSTWVRIFLANLFSESIEPLNINKLQFAPIVSSRSFFDNIIGISSSNLSDDEVEELKPRVFHKIASESNDVLYFKLHDAWKLTPSGKSIYSKAITKAVIYIIRNPLDIAVSFAHHSSDSLESTISALNDPHFAFCNNIESLHCQLRQVILDWSRHVESWLDISELPVKVIRYEDLIANPYSTFNSVLTYLEISEPEQKIKKAIFNSSFPTVSKMEESLDFNEKPIKMDYFFRSGKPGNWVIYLQNEMVEKIFSNHQKVMKRFGYFK